VGLFSVGAVAILSFTVMWSPPSGSNHAFSTASDYNAERESGCTNSGEGCHGEETSYSDYNDYHPNTQCVTCHDFDGVGCLPCHSPGGRTECQTCHDGTFDGASDCERITDPYPKGHYRETTHTATGTDMRVFMRGAEGGKAKVDCKACHSRDLMTAHTDVPEAKGSPYGTTVGCGECHNDTRSFGLEQVLSDWERRRCEDCHTETSSSPMHATDLASSIAATGPAGCGDTGRGCHDDENLHGLHADAPKDCSGSATEGEPACHDLSKQAHQPEARGCGTGARGACHDAYTNASYGHKKDRGLHDGGRGLAAASLRDLASGLLTRCDACHLGDLTAEHARPNSDLASANTCRACHNHSETTAVAIAQDWPGRGTADQCLDCHGSDGIPTPHTGLDDSHAGLTLDPDGTRSPGACGGSLCHDTTDVRILHRDTGCLTSGCHRRTGHINGSSKLSCGGDARSGGCHAGFSRSDGHGGAAAHVGIELATDGTAGPGSCARVGCHPTVDLVALHRDRCDTPGCHTRTTPPTIKSCGGTDPLVACHLEFSAAEHFADHDALREGIVKGVEYRVGENVGCFGCHSRDLSILHRSTDDSPITGGGATDCRVCHDDPRDPGNGAYAALPAVKRAVASRDVRCVACHDSGTSEPDRSHAASAHKRISDESVLATGYVWADPLSEWAAAFRSPTGGGHNVLDAGVVGASTTKRFPVTQYTSGTVTFTWRLPDNAGRTRWLTPREGEDFSSLAAIREAMITCEDCHAGTDAMLGPHGAAVPIIIDPDYSQTEYANPTRGLSSQFAATGTDRVICMKCHDLGAGSVPGYDEPGGHPVHAQHAEHPGAPVHHPLRYGEKCIDCHLRIPHASRSPRLLVRTIPGDGRPADVFPYVQRGHRGLAGVLLQDYRESADMTRASCVTNGCHGYHDEKNHPERSDIPTAPLWP
jgi:hypothetical protein